MADKKLNELATASDASFIYGEASDGAQKRVSKANLVVSRQRYLTGTTYQAWNHTLQLTI